MAHSTTPFREDGLDVLPSYDEDAHLCAYCGVEVEPDTEPNEHGEYACCDDHEERRYPTA